MSGFCRLVIGLILAVAAPAAAQSQDVYSSRGAAPPQEGDPGFYNYMISIGYCPQGPGPTPAWEKCGASQIVRPKGRLLSQQAPPIARPQNAPPSGGSNYTSYYSRDQFNGGSPPSGAYLPGDSMTQAQKDALQRRFERDNNTPEAIIRNFYADITGQRRIVAGPQKSNDGLNAGFGRTPKPQRQFNGYANGARSRTLRAAPVKPAPRRPGSMIGKVPR